MATAFATDGEGSTFQFIRFGRIDAGLPGLALEGHLNAVADASAARVLAARNAEAPADAVESRVEAEGLDVTGGVVEITLYLDEPILAGNYANGGPNLHNYLLRNVPAYAAAVANPDFDFVGIGIASSGSNALGNAELGVSAVFVDTDAVAFIDQRDDSGTFEIWGTNGPDEIVGTDGGEVIRTNDPVVEPNGPVDPGGNTVLAGAGNDTIYSTGDLANTLNGGAGNDTYWDVKAGDVIVETADGGIDTILVRTSFSLEGYANVDNLSAVGTIIGNDLSNTLRSTFGTSATLDGKGGDDILQGGALNDLFIVDSTDDVVEENPRWTGSYDVVRAYTDYTLGAGQAIEQLELRRVRDADGEVVQDVSATGNEFGNRIIGNDQRNALDGGAGDDELIGGRGTDVLTGGTGADVFRFAEAPGADGPDRITDFESGTDRIWLDAGALGVDLGDRDSARLSSAAFQDIVRRGTEAVDPEDRLLWDAETRTAYADLDGPGGRGPVAFLTFDAAGDLPDVTDVWLV